MTTRRLIASFILGAIAGAALVTVLTAAELENTTVQRDLFLTIATEQQQQLQQMRGQLEQFQTRPAVETVRLHLIGLSENKRETLELELTDRLRSVSSGMVGQIIEEVDPQMARNLYHNREITHKGTRYLLRVETVIIAPTAHFFIDIQLVKDNE